VRKLVITKNLLSVLIHVHFFYHIIQISCVLIWCGHCEILKIIRAMCLLQEFKLKAHLARHYATAHGLAIRSGSPRPIMKTRTAFYLCTTPLTRISRRLCRHLIQPRHAARAPFWPINIPSVKQECKDTNINIIGSIRWESLVYYPTLHN